MASATVPAYATASRPSTLRIRTASSSQNPTSTSAGPIRTMLAGRGPRIAMLAANAPVSAWTRIHRTLSDLSCGAQSRPWAYNSGTLRGQPEYHAVLALLAQAVTRGDGEGIHTSRSVHHLPTR
jgi:hypothetical protein